jgi:predicted sulfurtransferase
MQPSDEDAQGNVLPEEEIERKRMAASQKTPSKEDIKPTAQSEAEAEESPLSAEQPRYRLRKRYHESETMKQLFAKLARDNQKQFKEQEEKHTMEIAALKRANLDTHNLLTTKTTPAQTMSDHISTAHFNAMTKPSDTLFDGTP